MRKLLIILLVFISGFCFGSPLVKRYIEDVQASSVLTDSQGTYSAENLIDGSWRSWAEGSKGNGVGEYFTLNVRNEATIAGFGLKNGYGNVDHYAVNNRVKAFKIFIDGTYTETIPIKDSVSFEQYSFSKPVNCKKNIRFVIDDVYPGTKFNDTCVAEILLLEEICEDKIFYENVLRWASAYYGMEDGDSQYNNNRETIVSISDTDKLLIWDYLPFDFPGVDGVYLPYLWDYKNNVRKKTKVALLDNPSTLRLTDNLPRLDGATAMYPMYSSFVRAVYPEPAAPRKIDDDNYLRVVEWLYLPHDGYIDENSVKFINNIVWCSTTSKAYQRLIDGETDIVFCYEPSDAERQSAAAQGKTFNLTPIAKDAFIFIVNEKNRINNLTQKQIRDIYSGRVTNWKPISGADEPIIAYQRPENSGSQTILQSIMRGETIMHPILEGESIPSRMFSALRMVAADFYNYNSAIGYSFLFYMNQMAGSSGIKALSVDGIVPNRQNVQNNKYPFVQTIYAVTTGNESENTKKFITWILSAQGQELVGKTGYTPLR